MQSSNIWEDDVLGREKVANFLENIVKQKTGNFVLTINSPWGTGKTFLIQRMIKDLERTNPCIYFNAWEEDSSSSAFLSFVSVIQREFQRVFENESAKRLVNEYLTKAGRFFIRLVPIGLKGGVRYILGDNGLEELKDVFSEKVEEDFSTGLSKWLSKEIDAHLAKNVARSEFKESLSDTLEVLSGDGVNLPLIIFVDDLDRCKPTFSVELLESIKHVFNIKNVVFVVAVDSNQLAESVKSVYGLGMDGDAYLKKILENQYNLPNLDFKNYSNLLFNRLTISKLKLFLYDSSTPNEIFSAFSKAFNLSLRDQDQIFNKLHLSLEAANDNVHFALLNFLLIVSYKYNLLFSYYRNSQLNLEGLFNKLLEYLSKRYLPILFHEVLKIYDICISQPNEMSNFRRALGGIRPADKLRSLQFKIYSECIDSGFDLRMHLNLVDMLMHFQ